MQIFNKFRRTGLITASAMVLAACSGDDGSGNNTNLPGFNPNDPQPVPTVGQTSFVSADGYQGQASQDDANANNANNTDASAEGDSADRSVEEGDIYRVEEASGHILNLNAYRGLQIIDFSDPTDPTIVGRVQVSGTPIEMYQVGNRVFMLLNNWRGYYGSRDDVQGMLPDTFEGGVVVVADVSDPTNPVITGQANVPGYIRTSRLTRGDGKEALYVVANGWFDGTSETYVKSFSVSAAGALDEKTELSLGGYVTDIQATGTRLMVARQDYQTGQGSQVSVIDISDPNGTMVEGNSVPVSGYVANKYNMDIDGDILRVVSGNWWNADTNTNFVETFDAADIQNITAIDSATFGDNEDLFATLFLGEKAFFVTYRRVDPFHAFHIAADGTITEKSEFVVSGWNDYFKPVEAQSRLIGIGKNDTNGTTMAVSLYDITDLENPTPLITREEIDLQWSWSEANWDDRAFTVLEKGTSVLNEDGQTVETGLVLLPFSGWDDTNEEYVSAVQIFTFSRDTLTMRGTMDHGTPVRRSFVADHAANTTGNLSEVELSLFNTSDTDNPVELGRVELAPNYTDFFTYGQHGVRRKNNSGYYGWWWSSRSSVQPMDELEVVSLSDDVDTAAAQATIAVPAGSETFQVGDQLVTIWTRLKDVNDYDKGWESQVDVYDMTLPTMPVLAGSEVYDDLPNRNSYYGWWGPEDCFDCTVAGGYYYGYGQQTMVVGDALVLPETHTEQEITGTVRSTYVSPAESERPWDANCWDESTEALLDCTYLTGSISCDQVTRTDGVVQDEVCRGTISQCTQDAATQETTCVEVDPETVPTVTQTYTNDQYRYWYHYDLHILDVSDPANMPAQATVLSMPRDEEAAGLIADGSKLYVNYKKPTTVPGDSRPYVAYFFRTYDLSTPAAPVSGADVNIPGVLIEVDGDNLITRDSLWGDTIVESSLNRLKLQGNMASLQGVRRFPDEEVLQVMTDGSGHVLATHRLSWLVNYERYGETGWEDYDYTVKLSVLDLTSPTFDSLSTSVVDDWASLTAAFAGRAVFTVPGGLLVVNLDDATAPEAQAYFALRGWPQGFTIDDRTVYFAAGNFGLYSFDVDTYNLLSTPGN